MDNPLKKRMFGQNGFINKYQCPYCCLSFEQRVGYGKVDQNIVSSQVRCPRCKNFLKTWKDGVREE